MAPVFGFAMIALNHKANKTSRFYIKGSGFDNTSQVWLQTADGTLKKADDAKPVPPGSTTTLLVRLKWSQWPHIKRDAVDTGEVDVTITVKNTGDNSQSTPTTVTVLSVDDDDL